MASCVDTVSAHITTLLHMPTSLTETHREVGEQPAPDVHEGKRRSENFLNEALKNLALCLHRTDPWDVSAIVDAAACAPNIVGAEAGSLLNGSEADDDRLHRLMLLATHVLRSAVGQKTAGVHVWVWVWVWVFV